MKHEVISDKFNVVGSVLVEIIHRKQIPSRTSCLWHDKREQIFFNIL